MTDWFYTALFERIHETNDHQFNSENDPRFFNTKSEALEAINALTNADAQVPGTDKETEFVQTVAKTCHTFRKILVDELDFPRLYHRYLLMAAGATPESFVGLLNALANLLQGRQLLG